MEILKSIKWPGIAGLLLGIFMFFWLMAIAIAPINKNREFQNLVNSDSVFTKKFDTLFHHPDMAILVKEKAYKEALLKLSERDSIQLVINLSDSTVNLSIKGVIIHQTKILEFEKDKFLGKIPLMQEIKLLAQPLMVLTQFATIVKEPVVVRHAPKDTAEAAQNAWKPDTLIQNPAFAAFTIEHGFQIIIEQDGNKNFHDKWKKFGFKSQLLYRKTVASISNFVCIRKQEYQPTITIKMPVNDLRAIYRALPGDAFIVLKL